MRYRIPTLFAVFALISVMAAAPGSAHAGAPPTFAGPFELRQYIVFHVVNPSGAAFAVNLHWRDPARAKTDRPLLVRVFDPQEHVLIRHDAPGEKGGPNEQSISLPVPASADHNGGVYEVAVNGFTASIDFATDPPLSFGVFGYPNLAVSGNQYSNVFVYLPPGLNSLTARAGEAMQSLKVLDVGGAAKIDITGAGETTTARPTVGEHVWRLAAKANGVGTLNFAGMPIILCPDEASAKAIHSSVDVLDDGTICFHKFQIRAHEILKRYRTMPPSAFAVQPPVMIRYKQAWLAQPVRNALLIGPYGVFAGLDVVLIEQDLESASPWFGCIHTWRDERGAKRADNPWASYTRLGLSRAASAIGVLAAVLSIHEPFNPLYTNDALRNRVVIAAMQELMMIREHEHVLPEYDDYQGGMRAFTLASFTVAFQIAARMCPEDVRAVWADGLAHMIDHHAVVAEVATVVNQWTFLIRAMQQFADGVDDPWYAQMVKRHLRQIRERAYWGLGQAEAGYFCESEGPDATYVGLELQNLANVYASSPDPDLLEMLRRCFDLFNHTLATEPGGKHVGASSFSHRTVGDFAQFQSDAGVTMLAGELPEAAVHAGRSWLSKPMPRDAASLRTEEQNLASRLYYLNRRAYDDPAVGEAAFMGGPELHFQVWEHFPDHVLEGRLPADMTNRFTRSFGGEFFCVRRPAYYAFVYAGRTMGEWQKPRRPTEADKQYPRNGGGLCMFWSPAFGSSVLGHNWAASAANTIIVERAGGAGPAAADWEDYWSVESQFDTERATARITGLINNQPLKFERRYQFLDEGVVCNLVLHADDDVQSPAIWECFPYSTEKTSPIHVQLLDALGRPAADGMASAVVFSNDAPEAHILVFAQPRKCADGRDRAVDDYGKSHEHARVLTRLGDRLSRGQEISMRWLMCTSPSTPAALAQTIASALQRLHATDALPGG